MPAPSGPHTPISNIAHESAPAAPPEMAEGDAGPADAVLEPAGDGRESIAAGQVVMESVAGGAAAPMTALPDVGRASFRNSDVNLEAVHGTDTRIQVKDTAAYPYRLNASLLITAGDGSQWVGTGWFISPRTLITAGHCVFIKNSSVPGRDGWAKSIQVMPGRNGKALPFGAVTSTEFHSVRGWGEGGDENYDYGAIILPVPLGQRTGTLGFGNFPDAALVGEIANVTGYPGDKPPGSLWYDSRAVASANAAKVYYDIDTAGGQSGAAVYIVHEGKRLAVAVHAYGGATTNSGTRITAPVFANLQAWKR